MNVPRVRNLAAGLWLRVVDSPVHMSQGLKDCFQRRREAEGAGYKQARHLYACRITRSKTTTHIQTTGQKRRPRHTCENMFSVYFPNPPNPSSFRVRDSFSQTNYGWIMNDRASVLFSSLRSLQAWILLRLTPPSSIRKGGPVTRDTFQSRMPESNATSRTWMANESGEGVGPNFGLSGTFRACCRLGGTGIC
jgi:hypothetical protein